MGFPAELQFLAVKTFQIVAGGKLDGMVFGLVGLQDCPATTDAAPCPTHHLGENLECPFGGVIIREG